MITRGEKNELANLIGNFNPTWDAQGGNDEAFFQAVSVAGMILEKSNLSVIAEMSGQTGAWRRF